MGCMCVCEGENRTHMKPCICIYSMLPSNGSVVYIVAIHLGMEVRSGSGLVCILAMGRHDMVQGYNAAIACVDNVTPVGKTSSRNWPHCQCSSGK